MRPLIVAGNWKMNLGRAQARALSTQLCGTLPKRSGCRYLLAPGAIALADVAEILAPHPHIEAMAQSCHAEPKGAFTGWVSAEQLVDAGASAVLVGHSERRRWAAETHAAIAGQLAAARRCKLAAMLCLGEDLAERQRGATAAVLRTQLDVELQGMAAQDVAALTVAYEPIWAIGTGQAAQPEDVQQVHQLLRAWLVERFGEAGEQVPLLYGGSVTPDNAAALGALEGVDGFLVGAQSLIAAAFVQICERLHEAKR